MKRKEKKRKLLVVSLSFGFCIWLLWLFSFVLTPICPNSLKAHRYNHLLKPLKMQVKDDEKSPKTTTTNTPTILETVELRVKKVEEFCNSRNNIACRVDHLLVLKERNLVWCPVYKSGTSAWMTYLVHLSKQSPQEKDRLIAHNSGIGTALP